MMSCQKCRVITKSCFVVSLQMLILKYSLSDQACADEHQGYAIARACGCPHKIQASNLQSVEGEHKLQNLMTFSCTAGQAQSCQGAT